jgi:hypothetical protein
VAAICARLVEEEYVPQRKRILAPTRHKKKCPALLGRSAGPHALRRGRLSRGARRPPGSQQSFPYPTSP